VVTYVLLARIIAAQSAMAYDRYVATRQFDVAGINAASTRRMWTPERLNDGSEGAWGDGWAVLQGAPQRQVAGMGGARSAFIAYPDQGLAIVGLTNLVGANPQNFIPQIAAFYGAGAPVPTVSRAARPSPAGSRR